MGAGVSSSNPGEPTHCSVGSSRANKTKHKEAKVEVKDLNILDGFRDNFLHHLSLKRNNDNNRSIVDSDSY